MVAVMMTDIVIMRLRHYFSVGTWLTIIIYCDIILKLVYNELSLAQTSITVTSFAGYLLLTLDT